MDPALAGRGRGGRSGPAVAAQPRARPGRAFDRGNPRSPRFRHPQRRRHPRPPLQGRSRQGVVRLRRGRRQFRFALLAGHGLRPAPPSVRRSGRGAKALGAMRSAAWARLPRRWPARRAKRASTSCSRRRSRKSSSSAAGRSASSPAARRGGPASSSPGSIRNCCSTSWSRPARPSPRSRRGCTIGNAKARLSG